MHIELSLLQFFLESCAFKTQCKFDVKIYTFAKTNYCDAEKTWKL